MTLQAICASFNVSALWEREIYEGLEIVKFIQIALSLVSTTKKCLCILAMLIAILKHFSIMQLVAKLDNKAIFSQHF